MLIRVIYRNGKYDMVKPYFLDQMISSGKVRRFLRSSGWATVGTDRMRQAEGPHQGPERRHFLVIGS